MPLIEAIKQNNKEEVSRLLNLKVDSSGKKFIDEVDGEGFDALYWAMICGYVHFIDLLLRAGANINKQYKNGGTLIYQAAYAGDAEVIPVLKAAGGNVNTPDNEGTTPVCIAAQGGGFVSEKTDAETITALKAAGANVNTANNGGFTPVFIAAANGRAKIICALKAAGAHMDTLCDSTTPVFVAADAGYPEAITALLEAGADASIKTPSGTALECARKGKEPEHLKVVRLLETHFRKYPNGIKPIQVIKPEQKHLSETALQSKTTVILIKAIKQNNKEEVFRLLNLKIDVSGKKFIDEIDGDHKGNALYWAAHYGYAHFIEPLIKAGADVNKPDKNGMTPIHKAASNGQFAVVAALVAGHADVNIQNKDGCTPVYAGALEGHPAAVIALLNAGADASLTTEWGDTVLNVAQNGQKPEHAEIVGLLEAHFKRYPNGIKPANAMNKEKNLPQSFFKANDLKPVSLIEAIKKNNQEEVFRLLNLKKDSSGKKIIDEIDMEHEGDALYWAAERGYVHFIGPLLKAGLNINKQQKDGITPVLVAALKGHAEVITALKAVGADVDTPDNDGITPVFFAAREGYAETIRALKAADANLDTPNSNGKTPVFIAAENGHAEAITALGNAGANMDTSYDGKTPVFIAAEEGRAEVITALEAAGANMDTPYDGKTPVFIAAEKGHAEAITALGGAGANLNTPNKDGKTPVFIAAENWHAEAITALGTAGANMDTPYHDETPACIAATGYTAEVITALGDAGANMNTRNKNGETPLYIAAKHADTEYAKYVLEVMTALIDAGAKVNIPNKYGETPVYAAAYRGNVEAIYLLAVASANVNIPTRRGETPVHIAFEEGHTRALGYLLEFGADATLPKRMKSPSEWAESSILKDKKEKKEIVELLEDHLKKYPNGVKPFLIEAIKENYQSMVSLFLGLRPELLGRKIIDEVDGECGASALHWAAGQGHIHFIDPLLKAGADVNKQDKNGNTPVYDAAQEGHVEVITTLKAAGANMNTPNVYGWTPIYIAAYQGHAEVIAALKAAGVDVNTLSYGTTPIFIAALKGNAEAITALKIAGANVEIPDEDGRTPVYVAAEHGHAAAITALLEAGADASVKTPQGTALECAKQGTKPEHVEIVKLLEAHLKQYPNGIKPAQAANKQETAKTSTSATVPSVDKEVKTTREQEVKTDRDLPTEPKKPAPPPPQPPAASKNTVDMFSSVQVNSSKKPNTDWEPIIDTFEQSQTPQTEQGFLVSCQIDYKDLSLGTELGQGSFGIVYKGTYQFASVAIKKLQMGNLSSEAQEEFRKEAEMMAQLRHPNIVHFYGYCSVPKCLVMEYMPKGSLFNVLQDKKQVLDWSVRIRIAIDMASGLAFLHSKNILHRDVKSLNVLLDEQGKARLTDFGLSKVKYESTSLSNNPKKSKELVGTLPWMAPELFAGEKHTYKSDIYSLGITFWELASRQIPYVECAKEAISTFVPQGKRETIPQDCPEKLAHLIQQCWSTSLEARPTAADIAKFMTTDAEILPSPAPVVEPAIRGGNEKLNLADKKGEQEKTRYVLEQLRTFFREKRDTGTKTENYVIYNEYLKKAHDDLELIYDATKNKHILYVHDEPVDAETAAKELSKIIKSLANVSSTLPQAHQPARGVSPRPAPANKPRVVPAAAPPPPATAFEQKSPPGVLHQFSPLPATTPRAAAAPRASANQVSALRSKFES